MSGLWTSKENSTVILIIRTQIITYYILKKLKIQCLLHKTKVFREYVFMSMYKFVYFIFPDENVNSEYTSVSTASFSKRVCIFLFLRFILCYVFLIKLKYLCNKIHVYIIQTGHLFQLSVTNLLPTEHYS